MGILTHTFNQTAKLIGYIQSEFGDQVHNSAEDLEFKCRFRYITQMQNQNYQEAIQTSETIMWCDIDIPIVEGSIVLIEGSYWRVDRLVKARKLSGSTIEFYKSYMSRHQIAEES